MAKYLNPYQGSTPVIENDESPVEHAGYLIYHRVEVHRKFTETIKSVFVADTPRQTIYSRKVCGNMRRAGWCEKKNRNKSTSFKMITFKVPSDMYGITDCVITDIDRTLKSGYAPCGSGEDYKLNPDQLEIVKQCKTGKLIFEQGTIKFEVPVVFNGHQYCADWHGKKDLSMYPDDEGSKSVPYMGFTIGIDPTRKLPGFQLYGRTGGWCSARHNKRAQFESVHAIILSEFLTKYNLL